MSGDKNNISSHILPTSSSLLGLCFVILSFMKVSKLGAETIIDEMVAVTNVLFLVSSLLSYISIRSKAKGDQYEKIADIIFICGLFFLTAISITVSFEIV